MQAKREQWNWQETVTTSRAKRTMRKTHWEHGNQSPSSARNHSRNSATIERGAVSWEMKAQKSLSCCWIVSLKKKGGRVNLWHPVSYPTYHQRFPLGSIDSQLKRETGKCVTDGLANAHPDLMEGKQDWWLQAASLLGLAPWSHHIFGGTNPAS